MSDMQKQFESWMKKYLFDPNLTQDKYGYESEIASQQREAWKASRAALVVELPCAEFFNDTNDSPVLCYRAAEIERRLDAAGVQYK